MQDKGKGLQFTASRVGDMLHKHRSAVMDIQQYMDAATRTGLIW